MKIFSIKSLFAKGTETFIRFPLPLIFAIAVSGIGIYIAGMGYRESLHLDKFYKIMMTCFLGAILFIALTVYFEKNQIKSRKKDILNIAALLFLTAYYFSLPFKLNFIDLVRFCLLAIGLHTLVSFVAFTAKNQINAFWQYNKTLFLRFLTSALYSVVLYLGLALAILAIDKLFNVNIDSRAYFRLWIFITGVFNTWFFLTGMPANYDELEKDETYPKGLKVFSQYVLLPLVTIYLVILYVYGFKILIQWKLPDGWVSYLVLGFSVSGILSLLLLHPIQSYSENKWIKIYSRWFYRALFPLIILLFVAIGRRIHDYGITENRYFILFLAIWMTGISSYLLINKLKNIKSIPITLCLIAFLSGFGPWGAFSVSIRSQLNIFKKIIIENKLLENGKIKKAESDLSFKVKKDMSSIVEYFSDVHSYQNLQPYFQQNLDSLFPDTSYINKPLEIMKLMGVEFVNRWQRDEKSQENFYFYAEKINKRNCVNISGYNYFINVNEYFGAVNETKDSLFKNKYLLNDSSLTIDYFSKDGSLTFTLNESLNIQANLFDIVKGLSKNHKVNDYNIDAGEMVFKFENEKMAIMIYFTSISGQYHDEKKGIRVGSMQGEMFLKIK